MRKYTVYYIDDEKKRRRVTVKSGNYLDALDEAENKIREKISAVRHVEIVSFSSKEIDD